MRHEFSNVLELYNAVRGGFDPTVREGAFADLEIWDASPDRARMLFWDDEDIYDDDDVEYAPIDGDDESLPRVAVLAGVRYFLMGDALRSVFRVFEAQQREVTLGALVDAINHYREFDSFQTKP